LAANLLGAGILGRHWPPVGARDQRSLEAIWIQKFGDAEIQQPRNASVGDQDIRGFEITVDHELFMGIMHGRTNLAKKPQSFVDGELIFVAILVYGRAFYVLHDQIGRAILAAAAVEELHNIGMVEGCEGLALIAKSIENLLRIDSGLNHFDRDLLAIILVVAFAEIDDRHPPLANLAEDAIGTNSFSRHFFRQQLRLRGEQIGSGTFLEKI
jgi:hypothetical protein